MKIKNFIIITFICLLACVSCKKDEPAPPILEYYLIVYNTSPYSIYVSFYTEKKIASGNQFSARIDKSQYDNLWLGEAAEHLYIYKETDSVNVYVPQSIYQNPTSHFGVFNEFSNKLQKNDTIIERHCKTFSVSDEMFKNIN
ncbi:MAG: hypothetical protein FWF72_00850 [Paludibacter sp.]|nr:hypothetical protein [Paludibacter sp.]